MEHKTTSASQNETPNEVLEVSVSDTAALQDVGPGGAEAPEAVDGSESEYAKLIGRYVKWEGKPARRVTDADLPRVLEEAIVLGTLCRTPLGPYNGANAVAHNQIDHTDPLRFFVSSSGEVVINPVIISHTKVPIDSYEACTSFPEHPPKMVKRYHVITAQFQQLNLDRTLSEVREVRFSGPDSRVFQHEVAHLNGHCIHDADVTPEHAVGEPK